MFVTYQDVVNRWNGHGNNTTFPVSKTVTDTLIEDAEALILREFPTLAERVESKNLNPTLIKQVVSRMINSYVINGNGLSQRSSTVGPYTESRSYSARTSRIYLELTDADRELLSPMVREPVIGVIDTIDYDAINTFGICGPHSAADRRAGWQHLGWLPL